MKKSLLSRIAEAVTSDPLPEVYTCSIATAYHTENIAPLMEPSVAYSVPPAKVIKNLRNKTVFKYVPTWVRVKLDPTPNDAFPDSVTLVHNGAPVGFVREQDQQMVKKLIGAGYAAAVRFYDGPFRIVDQNGQCFETDGTFAGDLIIIRK